MQFFGRLLNRAILSHLLVAVPPAVVLGLLVLDINRDGLLLEAQHLHLALATQLRDTIRTEVEKSVIVVGQAERVLDLSDLTIEARQQMLRAIVADGRIPYLALYRPDGGFDSLVKARGDEDIDRVDLPAVLRDRVADLEWTTWTRDAAAVVIFPWRRGDELFGYLGTALPLAKLNQVSGALAARFLVDGGQIDVMDAKGRILLSSAATSTSATSSAFAMVQGDGTQALAQSSLGITRVFEGPDGQKRLGALASAPGLGWVVAVSRPQEVALASLNQVRLRAVLMSVIAAMAAGLVGLLMARQITGPMQQLVRSVRRAAQRGFAPDAQVRAKGELGQLASAFNHALAQMAEYRRQVRRTTQLRLRLSRFAPTSTSARELLARASSDAPPRPPEKITVLYADVVFDDPDVVETEHLVTILGEFFSASHEAIRQEGGWVDRYSGDTVIGVFPAGRLASAAKAALAAAETIANDARAIGERWAALSSVRMQAAVGVVSGEAQLVGEDESGDPTVHGDIVERAANLQRRAAGDVILVDKKTEQALEEALSGVGGAGEAAFVYRAPTRP